MRLRGLIAAMSARESSAASIRMWALRKRFGDWAKQLHGHDPTILWNTHQIEVWTRNAGEMLEEAAAYLPNLPQVYGYQFYQGGSAPSGGEYFYPIDKMNEQEKRRLFELYEKWGQSGESRCRLQASLYGAMFANDTLCAVEEYAQRRDRLLHQAAELVVASPEQAQSFVFLCTDYERWNHPPHRELPVDVLVREVRWAIDSLEEKGIASPLLLEFLDTHDAQGAARPGAYLEKAAMQLDSGKCRVMESRRWGPWTARRPNEHPSVASNLSAAKEWIRKLYRKRYGSEIPENAGTQTVALGQGADGLAGRLVVIVPPGSVVGVDGETYIPWKGRTLCWNRMELRIPGRLGRRFRDNTGHLFRNVPATHSGMIPATFWAGPESVAGKVAEWR